MVEWNNSFVVVLLVNFLPLESLLVPHLFTAYSF